MLELKINILGGIITLMGVLLLIEKNPIYGIIELIIITISIGIILSYKNFIECEYITYILLIVYMSALIIIYSFIIMLSGIEHNTGIQEGGNKRKIIIILLLSLIFFYLLYFNNKDFYPEDNFWVWENSLNHNMTIMEKTGYILYTDNISIFKLILSVFILLSALVGIFNILL